MMRIMQWILELHVTSFNCWFLPLLMLNAKCDSEQDENGKNAANEKFQTALTIELASRIVAPQKVHETMRKRESCNRHTFGTHFCIRWSRAFFSAISLFLSSCILLYGCIVSYDSELCVRTWQIAKLSIPVHFHMCRWSLIGSDFFPFISLSSHSLLNAEHQVSCIQSIHVYIICERASADFLCRRRRREILEVRIWFRYLFIWCSFDDVQKFILDFFLFRSFSSYSFVWMCVCFSLLVSLSTSKAFEMEREETTTMRTRRSEPKNTV